ncbi:hypothetical protein [Pectobacterium versatile]|uniref:hypothetical protein n=1 Tax=Pectobacterium versatile TaxID=2488639 RepID=UPI001CCD46DB|nr:hypothetical protein [Pectobacterium versatile]
MSRMDAAKVSAASGTRHWRSEYRSRTPKVSRSDAISAKKPVVKALRRLSVPCRACDGMTEKYGV